MRRVALTPGTGPQVAYVRELRGEDEELVASTDSWSAIALIDRVLVAVPGAAVRPGDAVRLSAADRDRILAAIYRHELGARITSLVSCPACASRFEIDFELEGLVAALAPVLDGVTPLGDGRFALADGTRFRVPTGEDELVASVAADAAAMLVERCVEAGTLDAARFGAVLEQIAPVIDLELEARCPECGHAHDARFAMQSFLLARLLGERAGRATEVHQLARGYGWSLAEILALPRSRRRAYVELVQREAR